MKELVQLSDFILLGILMVSCLQYPDTVSAFNNLSFHPKEITIKNSFPENNTGGHIQGIQIYDHQDSQYYFFTGSSDYYSYYAVADIKQRKILSVNKLLEQPFSHAGGFQIAQDLLAVGIEDDKKADKSKVMLFRILDPVKPNLRLLKTVERSGVYKRYTAGCVALAIRDEKVLVVVGNWDTKYLDFYSIAVADLEREDVNFQLVYTIDSENIDRSTWIERSWYPYQNVNFIMDSEGDLYLFGLAFDKRTEMEVVDMFQVGSLFEGKFQLNKVATKKFKKSEATTFGWGGGVYLNTSEEICVLSTAKRLDESIRVNLYE